MQTSCGSPVSARATPTSLRWPCERSLGVRRAEILEVERGEGPFDCRRVACASRPYEIEQEAGGALVLGRDLEVLGHVEVVEELDGLPRPAEAEPGPLVGREAGDVPVGEPDAADGRGEAGERVDERRLARAVRSDQPHQLAGLDREVHVVERSQAAVGDRQSLRLEERHHASSGAPTAERGGFPDRSRGVER